MGEPEDMGHFVCRDGSPQKSCLRDTFVTQCDWKCKSYTSSPAMRESMLILKKVWFFLLIGQAGMMNPMIYFL